MHSGRGADPHLKGDAHCPGKRGRRHQPAAAQHRRTLLLSGNTSPIASAQQQTRYQTAASRSSPANHRVSAFALAVRARRLGFLAVAALRAPALDVIARSF